VWDEDMQDWVDMWGNGGAPPIGNPLGFAAFSRRIEGGDENRSPDLIFTLEPPEDYLINDMWGYRYVPGAVLTYICTRYYKSGLGGDFWKVQLNVQYTDAVLGDTTVILYPYGRDTYNFDPDKVNEYYFDFKY